MNALKKDVSGKKHVIGIYPGTFDPITKGHLQIIKRASKLVDHLIIGVAENNRKNPYFTWEERVDMVRTDIANLPERYCDIEVKNFDNLLINFAAQTNASCIIRGLRAVSDFEYEFQLTGMNTRLNPEIETIFLMAAEKWQFVSSSFVREIAIMGGDISEFVTPYVLSKFLAKNA